LRRRWRASGVAWSGCGRGRGHETESPFALPFPSTSPPTPDDPPPRPCAPRLSHPQIFTDLTAIGPIYALDPAARAALGPAAPPPPPPPMPFRTLDAPGEPHPGLRAYPFLGQVCRRWRGALDSPSAQAGLWPEVVIDFGHELITAVHTPIQWSDVRPSDDDFRAAFTATRLCADRMVRFIAARSSAVRRLVLANSEGYWSDDGDFVSLAGKHNFGPAHVGLLCGVLRGSLTELVIQHCNDWFSPGGGGVVLDRGPHALAAPGGGGVGGGAGLLCMLSSLPSLRLLALEDLHVRLDAGACGELGSLGSSLEELTITADAAGHPPGVAVQAGGPGAAGLPALLPPSWARLTRLTKLELRGHHALTELPGWLADLPSLTHLDVAACPHAGLAVVARLTNLRVLSLQSLRLGDEAPPGPPAPPLAFQPIPWDPLAEARAAAGLGGPGVGVGGGNGGQAQVERAVAGMAGDLAAAAGLGAAAGHHGLILRPPRAALLEINPDEADGADFDDGGFAAAAARVNARLDGAAAVHAAGGDMVAGLGADAAAADAAAVPRFAVMVGGGGGRPMVLGPGGGGQPPVPLRAPFHPAAAAPAVAPPRSRLPDLSALVHLTALNLSDNALTAIPPAILAGRLPALRHLDLSANPLLQAADGPLAPGLLSALPHLRVLDMRGVHAEAGLGYWSAAKCATMNHVAALARAAKRKAGGPRVLFDTD
jgi:hypothetical protein